MLSQTACDVWVGSRSVRFRDLLARSEVTEICALRSTFGVMAFHGGNLERMTDEIAAVAAERAGASLYAVIQAEPLREHLPSIEVRPEFSSALAAFLAHVDVVIAIHGYGRQGMWTDLLLGGTNRTLASHLALHLRQRLEGYNIVDDLDRIPADLRGMHCDNPVNGSGRGGVQLELPPRVRGLTPHAASYDRVDGRIEPTNSLIDAIVSAITSWPQDREDDLVR